MKRITPLSVITVLSLAVLLMGACNKPSTPASQQPIEIVSVTGPVSPINPGGPIVLITLKNVSDQPVVSLTANLGISRAGLDNTGFIFNYDVSTSTPLLPSKSISSQLTLIGGGFAGNTSYPLKINGKLQSGASFKYTAQVQIESPSAQNPDP
ncbi:MAG: hypothetical protein PHE50_06460 [Dehalococcoidales bacterium]|nr:hypothetical protein [Dehalococcoidales bacterium]